MNSLRKLDTFVNHSARNSYASLVDSEVPSARSSWTSVSDGTTPRDSYCGLKNASTRQSSFSRTPSSYALDSQASPVAPESPKLPDTENNHGPTVLRNLQNVKNVICISFGAFDRFFISWEDNEGGFHQSEYSGIHSMYLSNTRWKKATTYPKNCVTC
jgi:hypothetical protein